MEDSSDPRKVFIGGLEKRVNEADPSLYFGRFGSLKDHFIVPSQHAQSRNVAFITFDYIEDATKVLNQGVHILKGHKVFAKKCLSQELINNHRVFVSGFDKDTSQDDVEMHFSGCGTIIHCKLISGKNSSFVSFDTDLAVQEALRKNNHSHIKGNKITVKVARHRNNAYRVDSSSSATSFQPPSFYCPYNHYPNVAPYFTPFYYY